MMKTEQACKLVRKDPVVSLLVPQDHFRSLPVPVNLRGEPGLAFFFYPIDGSPGEKKQIMAPSARIVMNVENGRVAEVSTPPRCWLDSTKRGSVIGVYPPPGLEGQSSAECNRAYGKYFALCDLWCESITRGVPFESCPEYQDWRSSFDQLCEPGMLDYYSHFLSSTLAKGKTYVAKDRPERILQQVTTRPIAEPITALELTPHLKRLEAIVNQVGDEEIGKVWDAMRKSVATTMFRVGVAGEFQRGKSTVVNGILDDYVVPVGKIPTTALPISIRCGQSKAMRCSSDGLPVSPEPLDTAAMCEFMAAQSSKGERLGDVQVELPVSWLKEQRIEIIDMPGVGIADLEDPTSAHAQMAGCDAILLCVDATMPLSLSERSLLEDVVITKKVPQVAIVVTRMDQVPEHDRQQVVTRILHKLRDWDFNAHLWLSMEAYDGDSDMRCGFDEIRLGITEFSRAQKRLSHRKTQVAAQANHICELCLLALDLRRASQSKTDEVSEIAADNCNEIERRWERIAGSIDNAELSAERSIATAIRQLHDELRDELMHELSRTRNPREWWEKDLPYRMRRFWHRARREFEPLLSRIVSNDIASLNRALSKEFAVVLAVPETEDPMLSKDMDLMQSADHLTDLDTIRLWTRVGSGLATAAGYMLLGAPALLLSMTGGIAGDRALGGKIEEQRRKLTIALDDVLDRTMDLVMANTTAYLQRVYGSLETDLEEKKSVWVSSLEPHTKASDQEYDELIEEVRKIHAILNSPIDIQV